jgi:hypothetical protein
MSQEEDFNAAFQALIDLVRSHNGRVEAARQAYEKALSSTAHEVLAARDVVRRMLEKTTEEVTKVSADAKKLSEINKATAKLLAG